MSAIISHICYLCLADHSGDLIISDIKSRDENGICIKDKLKFLIPDYVNILPETRKSICTECYENVNNIYLFRQNCIKSINILNDYLQVIKSEKKFQNIPSILRKGKRIEIADNNSLQIQNIPNFIGKGKLDLLGEKNTEIQEIMFENVFVDLIDDDDIENVDPDILENEDLSCTENEESNQNFQEQSTTIGNEIAQKLPEIDNVCQQLDNLNNDQNNIKNDPLLVENEEVEQNLEIKRILGLPPINSQKNSVESSSFKKINFNEDKRVYNIGKKHIDWTLYNKNVAKKSVYASFKVIGSDSNIKDQNVTKNTVDTVIEHKNIKDLNLDKQKIISRIEKTSKVRKNAVGSTSYKVISNKNVDNEQNVTEIIKNTVETNNYDLKLAKNNISTISFKVIENKIKNKSETIKNTSNLFENDKILKGENLSIVGNIVSTVTKNENTIFDKLGKNCQNLEDHNYFCKNLNKNTSYTEIGISTTFIKIFTIQPDTSNKMIYKCRICKESFLKSELLNHTRTHSTVLPFECSLCHEKFKYLKLLNSHLHTKDLTFQCNICKIKFLTRDQIKSHKMSEHKSYNFNENASNKEENINESDKIATSGATTITKTENNIPKDKPYECKTCGRKFNRKSLLKDHYAVHSDVRPFKCIQCNKKFKMKRYLKEHMDIHSGKRRYECRICNKNFAQLSVFCAHKRRHNNKNDASLTDPKYFNCTTCSTKFESSELLEKHNKSLHSPLVCEICSQIFLHRKIFTHHLRTHRGDKSFKCEICQKIFSYKANLKRHKRIHMEIKPYKCQYCEKTFTYSNNLKDHIRTHTGDKPFMCTICGKAYAQSGDLNKHTKSHSEIKAFQCQICPYKSSRHDYLKRHMRSHSLREDKQFKCQICGKITWTQRALSNHIILTHSDDKNFNCQFCPYKTIHENMLKAHLRSHTRICKYCNKQFIRIDKLRCHEEKCTLKINVCM